MRKLKAHIQIQAPVQTVQSLTEAPRRREWMSMRSGSWFKTLQETYETTEVEGGTRLSVHMQYKGKWGLLDPLFMDGFHQSVSYNLSRLKQIAEAPKSN